MFYIIVSIITMYVLLKIYISIKHPFWNRQPVFHIYNLYYWFYRGIVHKTFPTIDRKYYDNFTITHYKYNKLSEKQKGNVKKFVVNNWSESKLNNSPYMKNIDYLSLFKKDPIQGIISGELLQMNNNNVMYVDFLCVDKNYRKKNIAPKLIYNFFLNNYNNSKIYLFKWENKTINILPLCIYNVLHYINIKLSKNNNIFSNIKIIEINKSQLHLINESEIEEKFNVSIFQNINKLIEMINSNYVIVYAALIKNKLIGLYFFKKYKFKKGNVYNCYASVKYDDDELFVKGFNQILNSLDVFTLSIDDISHSNILINSLNMFKPAYIETHSYYFYNYIKLSEKSNDVFILN